MNEKQYNGLRTADGCVVTVKNGRTRKLPRKLGVANHSPTGFEWGYAGSGPAQLALALLCDVLGDDERALRLHQRFKVKVIAVITSSQWHMTEGYIRMIVAELEAQSERSTRHWDPTDESHPEHSANEPQAAPGRIKGERRGLTYGQVLRMEADAEVMPVREDDDHRE
jgi:hypothetical protein